MKIPKIPTPVDQIPDDVRNALFTLVAYMANTAKIAFHVNLEGLKAGDIDLGNYEVNVQRTDVE